MSTMVLRDIIFPFGNTAVVQPMKPAIWFGHLKGRRPPIRLSGSPWLLGELSGIEKEEDASEPNENEAFIDLRHNKNFKMSSAFLFLSLGLCCNVLQNAHGGLFRRWINQSLSFFFFSDMNLWQQDVRKWIIKMDNKKRNNSGFCAGFNGGSNTWRRLLSKVLWGFFFWEPRGTFWGVGSCFP